MTHLQKVFLMGAAILLITQAVLGFLMYLITKKVEESALARKKAQKDILNAKRDKDSELYRKQYQKSKEPPTKKRRNPKTEKINIPVKNEFDKWEP